MPLMVRITGTTAVVAAVVLGVVVATPRGAASGKEYTVDPTGAGAQAGKARGTVVRSLQALVKWRVLKAGDTVYLSDGFYGWLRFRNRHNSGMVTVTAAPGARPRLSGLQVRNSSNWRFRGLVISPFFAPPGHGLPKYKWGNPFIVELQDDRNVTIEDSEIFSEPKIEGWSAADWRARAYQGILATGREIVLRNNRIRNISFAVQVHATHSLVEGNLIENFSGDGIRSLGDYGIYRGNTIKNCFKVDDNHDDGIQSWSTGRDGKPATGEIVGVVLSGNRIINYEDPNQPYRCQLQGIGLFGGMYVDWVIENNLVVVNDWNGIVVMGARNVRVVNNTVVDPDPGKPGPPWISITAHRNGTPSENSVIANNIAAIFPRPKPKDGVSVSSGVSWSSNYVPRFFREVFRDMPGLDFELRPGSAAIDAGDARYAPKTDIRGVPRPQGRGVDIGAYESRQPSASRVP